MRSELGRTKQRGPQSHLRARTKRSKAFAQSVSKRAQPYEDNQSKVMRAVVVVAAICALLLRSNFR